MKETITICDRCNRSIYETYTKPELERTSASLRYLIYRSGCGYDGSWGGATEKGNYDLCESCTKSFYLWLKKENK